MDKHQIAVIVGTGPGLGFALARRFARAEMHVALVARNGGHLETMAIECSGVHHQGRAYACDASDEAGVEALFRQVAGELGVPDVVVYNAGAFVPRGLLETTRDEFERCWRVGCLGGFLVARAAARAMLARPDPGGTILFTGATASLRGSAGFHNVAHVLIDGRIRPPEAVEHGGGGGIPDDMLDANAIAENYYRLHCQPRSAWTQELDLRPWVEKF